MDEPERWRQMASAPKDGSRILVTVRSSEQGPAEVDVVYWSHGDRFGGEGWRASDSAPGCVIEYAEPELNAGCRCLRPISAAPRPHHGRATMPSNSTGREFSRFRVAGGKQSSRRTMAAGQAAFAGLKHAPAGRSVSRFSTCAPACPCAWWKPFPPAPFPTWISPCPSRRP